MLENFDDPKIQELNLTNCIRVGDIALLNILKK